MLPGAVCVGLPPLLDHCDVLRVAAAVWGLLLVLHVDLQEPLCEGVRVYVCEGVCV